MRSGPILLVALVALSGYACSTEQLVQAIAAIRPALVAGEGRVSGRVVDQVTQRPIADARVVVGTQRTTTDAAGSYTAQGLTAGVLFLRVDAGGYQPFFGEIQVAASTTRFDVPLKPMVGGVPSPSPSPVASPTPEGSSSASPRPSASPSLSPVATPSLVAPSLPSPTATPSLAVPSVSASPLPSL
jgi:hypothetical protein